MRVENNIYAGLLYSLSALMRLQKKLDEINYKRSCGFCDQSGHETGQPGQLVL